MSEEVQDHFRRAVFLLGLCPLNRFMNIYVPNDLLLLLNVLKNLPEKSLLMIKIKSGNDA